MLFKEITVRETAEGYKDNDGWFDLLNKLATKIEANLSKQELKDFRVLQVKEKFGGLRFYIENCDNEEVNKFIDEYEDKSYHICEICGDKGSPNQNEFGWIRTICNKCLYEEEKKND